MIRCQLDGRILLSGKDVIRIVLVMLVALAGQLVAGVPAVVAGSWAQTALVDDALAAEAGPFAEGFSGHIRATDVGVQEALMVMAARSPTFRGMLEQLDRSNLIVWIIPNAINNAPALGRIHGFIGLVAERGGYRYVRIVIRPGLMLNALTHILAHELQHAVEIAGAPDVIDKSSLEQLYRRIGIRNGRAYDSMGALRASWDILKEMGEYGRGRPKAPAATE